MRDTNLKILFLALGVSAIIRGQGQLLYVPDQGSLTIPAGDTLYVGGDVAFSAIAQVMSKGVLAVGGSLTDNSINLNSTLYNLVFTGSGAGFYSGTPLQVSYLAINNPAGIVLNAPVTVGVSATFTAGNFVTSSTNPLIFSAGASPGSPTDASHVNGPVQYNGATAFSFPVGDATYYRNIDMNLTGNSDGMTAAYFHSNPPAGALTPPLAAVNQAEYWTLTPGGSATGTVTLNWDNARVAAGIKNFVAGELKVAHLTGGNWIDQNSLDATGDAQSGTVTTGNPFSSWSPFALGSTNSSDAPLPLKFLGISASLLSSGFRQVDWQVGDETGVRDYTVERGTDGVSFTDIGAVAASGSTGYLYTDTAAETSTLLYYRVRSNDFSGNPSYSPVAVVRFNGNAASISVLPNPVQGQFVVSFGDAMEGSYGLEIFSLDGRSVYRQFLVVSPNQDITISRPPGMAQGLYLVRLTRGDGMVYSTKLLFQ